MSDVALYPIRGQVAQINGKSEFIVYVPRADKYTYGTVKIGDGLLINSETGAVDFDRSEIKILEIKKNGVKIDPVNKVVNITIDKADVGLSLVDNTSDASKPVSILQEQRIQEIKNGLMDDIMNVHDELVDYKVEVEGLLSDAADVVDAKLLVINNTITQNKSSTDTELLRINNILKGKEQSLAYANYQEVVNVFNAAATNAYNVGQTIYVQSPNVPDLWVYSVENTHVDFAYVGDAEIIESLSEDGFVQFGYYKLAMMETKTTEVANAVTLNTAQTITGNKSFTGRLLWSGQLSYDTWKFDCDSGQMTLEYYNRQTNRRTTMYMNQLGATFGGHDRNGTYSAIRYTVSDNLVNLIGNVKKDGKTIALLEDINAAQINGLIDDSTTIVHVLSNNKLKFELDNSITNKLAKALVVPMSAPSKTELVAVNSSNSQTYIEIGEGLLLENGVLKATGGGQSGGGQSGTAVTVGGVTQTTWNADLKLDKQNATGTAQLKYDNGFAITTTNGDAFRYNGYEVATKYDIETNIISALNTEV